MPRGKADDAALPQNDLLAILALRDQHGSHHSPAKRHASFVTELAVANVLIGQAAERVLIILRGELSPVWCTPVDEVGKVGMGHFLCSPFSEMLREPPRSYGNDFAAGPWESSKKTQKNLEICKKVAAGKPPSGLRSTSKSGSRPAAGVHGFGCSRSERRRGRLRGVIREANGLPTGKTPRRRPRRRSDRNAPSRGLQLRDGCRFLRRSSPEGGLPAATFLQISRFFCVFLLDSHGPAAKPFRSLRGGSAQHLTKRRAQKMSHSYFSDLVHGRTPDGRELAPQDYQDALCALSDQHIRYCQLGDEAGMALCGGMMAAVLVARARIARRSFCGKAASSALPRARPTGLLTVVHQAGRTFRPATFTRRVQRATLRRHD